MSTFGRLFRVTTSGESHSPATCVIIDSPPSGIYISIYKHIQIIVNRRRPGQSVITTDRSESDNVELFCGVEGMSLARRVRVFDNSNNNNNNNSKVGVEKGRSENNNNGENCDDLGYISDDYDPVTDCYYNNNNNNNMYGGVTLGTPLGFRVMNHDMRKGDYNNININNNN
eukprot:Tbor_TRINITY_DN5401_c6_g5::TRINITY_DN5401_c6_g5_i1::g.24292::m.24292/K01736/aroC; chorismate synthase